MNHILLAFFGTFILMTAMFGFSVFEYGRAERRYPNADARADLNDHDPSRP